MSSRSIPERVLRIEPLDGYAPTIGRLVCMLTYARQTTLAAAAGLGVAELDHLHDPTSNSIGALLAHIATVGRAYHVLTFEDRAPSADEQARWEPALTLGAAPALNAHWAWFHVAEDEINHRGQIRWLRARLKEGAEPRRDE